MMEDRSGTNGGSNRTANVSRRTFLGAAGTAGATGFAGCLGGSGGVDTVKWAVVSPMSGPYESLGPSQRKSAKLAIQQINDSDDFEFTIEATYGDTGTDPEMATGAAEEIVDGDGASFVTGAISSSVALELNGFAGDNGVLYTPGAAAIPITGSSCNEYVFRFETNTAQVAEACATWTVENLGGKVWFHYADYAYGQSVYDEWKGRMTGVDGFQEVGLSKSDLGAKDFAPYVEDIKNSDAEVAVVGMTGGDLVRFVAQAQEQNLLDSVDVMTTTGSFKNIRDPLGPAGTDIYSAVRYVPKVRTGDNQDFVSAYEEAYDATPDNFSRVGYESIRMVAKGIRRAGSSDPADVKDTLAGLSMQTIFGQVEFRECDHQSTNPVWVGRNVLPSGEDVADVQLLELVEGEDAIPPCEQTGCEM